MRIKRILFFCLGWLAFAAGIVGIFVPVLPTTPFLLLATFLFANSSPRLYAWIKQTGVYRRYVAPFKRRGGLPFGQKLRILLVSFALMGVSAWAVPRIYVWVLLVAVAAWLIYLMFVCIPTVSAVAETDNATESSAAPLPESADSGAENNVVMARKGSAVVCSQDAQNNAGSDEV